MKVTASLPTGVAAIFFEGARRRRQLERSLVDRLEASGFDEVVLPVVDYLDPYEQMLSPTSREELYRFVSRDGALLALRSDFTPMLARLIAPRLASMALPLKLFYRGDVLRYQEARVGRERELYQVGGELLARAGETGVGDRGDGDRGDGDEAAVLEHCLDLVRRVTDQPLRVVVGFAGALDALLLAHPQSSTGDLGALVQAVGRRERRVARRSKPLLEVIEGGVPRDPSALGGAAASRLARIVSLVEGLRERSNGIDLEIDLAEFVDQALDPALQRFVGPRAYYDGLVFRVFAGKAGLPIAGGGRYDSLFQALGGDGVTAAGFSIGVDRLAASEMGA